MKDKKIYVIIISLLIVIIFGLSIKIYLMNKDYVDQKNILEETEKEVTLLKNQIKERCPDKFNFPE